MNRFVLSGQLVPNAKSQIRRCGITLCGLVASGWSPSSSPGSSVVGAAITPRLGLLRSPLSALVFFSWRREHDAWKVQSAVPVGSPPPPSHTPHGQSVAGSNRRPSGVDAHLNCPARVGFRPRHDASPRTSPSRRSYRARGRRKLSGAAGSTLGATNVTDATQGCRADEAAHASAAAAFAPIA